MPQDKKVPPPSRGQESSEKEGLIVTCPYRDIEQQLSTKNVILVDQKLDLRFLSRHFIEDDEKEVRKIMMDAGLFGPSPKILDELKEANPNINFIEISPYILIQVLPT